jgi:hypothetical protein
MSDPSVWLTLKTEISGVRAAVGRSEFLAAALVPDLIFSPFQTERNRFGCWTLPGR